MERESQLLNDIGEVIVKSWAWLLMVGIGLMGKIGMYLRGGKKETIWQQIGSMFLGIFGGFVASFICMSHYPTTDGAMPIQGAIIVPIVTMLSDRLAVILCNIDWKRFIEIALNRSFKDKDN